MTLGEDVEVVVTDEDAIGGSLSVELAGKGVGILDGRNWLLASATWMERAGKVKTWKRMKTINHSSSILLPSLV